MYADLLNALITLTSGLSIYSVIGIGSLPVDNGISMYLGAGATDQTFLDKGATYNIPVVINAKHSNQLMCLQALSSIHTHLSKLKDYPNTDDYQILNIQTTTSPNSIGQEANSQYLYGSILEVSFYIKGVEN